MAKNILICDDAAFMRMMIKDILTKNGYNVAGEAENGMKAVEKFKEVNPDLVLMDITMPEMDGIQALKEIKKLDGGAKVIMCSAMGQQAMVIESQEWYFRGLCRYFQRGYGEGSVAPGDKSYLSGDTVQSDDESSGYSGNCRSCA